MSIKVGGGAPIVVQSMTNTDTADVEGTARQVATLSHAGSKLVHITVDRDEVVATVPRIKERLSKIGVTTPCVYQKLNSAIMVVKAAEDRPRCDGADM